MPRRDEARSIGGESPSSHNAVKMRMQREVLAPGVEDGGDAGRPPDLGREVPGIAGEGGERVGGGAEEEIVDHTGSVEGQGAEFVGQGEDDVEVVDGEKVGAPRLEPVGLSQCLALRTVTVAARVVDGAPMPTAATRFEVAAEGRGTALGESADDLVLRAAHRMRSGVALAMTAQDVAELGRCLSPGRSRRLRGCTHGGSTRTRSRVGPDRHAPRGVPAPRAVLLGAAATVSQSQAEARS